MIFKDLYECKEFAAADQTFLREIFHPDKGEMRFRYSLAHAALKPGGMSKKHRLSVTEVYYILEGRGIMHVNDESQEVRQGHAVYIPPRAIQWIQNIGRSDLRFLCLVDPAWRKEYEEIL